MNTLVPAKPGPFAFDPETTALVVIDMQRDFLEPGGFGSALGNDVSLLASAVEPLQRVLAAARELGVTVIHTREGHRPDMADCPPAKFARGEFIGTDSPKGRILIRGEYGHDIVDELAPLPGEVVLDKPGKGSFYATDLELMLRNGGIQSLIGNIFYFYLARRLAMKEQRNDVTALPYGPSVPHMFIVTLVIMLPTYLATKDAVQAWTAGLAWAFIIGCIILIGAFVGPTIRHLTPRAAMLGTLAGISLAFISMRPGAQMWGALWIALPVFMIILAGFIAGVRLPGNFPIGLAALLVGCAIGWIGGYMEPAAVGDSIESIAIGIPSLNIDLLLDGLEGISP